MLSVATWVWMSPLGSWLAGYVGLLYFRSNKLTYQISLKEICPLRNIKESFTAKTEIPRNKVYSKDFFKQFITFVHIYYGYSDFLASLLLAEITIFKWVLWILVYIFSIVINGNVFSYLQQDIFTQFGKWNWHHKKDYNTFWCCANHQFFHQPSLRLREVSYMANYSTLCSWILLFEGFYQDYLLVFYNLFMFTHILHAFQIICCKIKTTLLRKSINYLLLHGSGFNLPQKITHYLSTSYIATKYYLAILLSIWKWQISWGFVWQG